MKEGNETGTRVVVPEDYEQTWVAGGTFERAAAKERRKTGSRK